MTKARQGDETAFELLVDSYRPILMSMALRKLHNTDDAKDVVQETFIKAYKSLKDFDINRPVRPWLSRICLNCIVDLARQRKSTAEPIENYEYSLSDGTSTQDKAEGSIQRGQIMEAVSRLPYRYRQIIMMRHFEQMDVNEIAEHLHKPEGTIKSWLFRARALLAKDLQPAMC